MKTETKNILVGAALILGFTASIQILYNTQNYIILLFLLGASLIGIRYIHKIGVRNIKNQFAEIRENLAKGENPVVPVRDPMTALDKLALTMKRMDITFMFGAMLLVSILLGNLIASCMAAALFVVSLIAQGRVYIGYRAVDEIREEYERDTRE